ncbi:MAG TPA: hypothetical protein VD813_02055, partial [Pseudonocardia sp.]|nr:hypothetical protein [Pseudonocardia sp.]
DHGTGLSAMARTTGFALAAGAVLLAEGAVPGTGWLRPHLSLPAALTDRLMAALRARGVQWAPAEVVPPEPPGGTVRRAPVPSHPSPPGPEGDRA